MAMTNKLPDPERDSAAQIGPAETSAHEAPNPDFSVDKMIYGRTGYLIGRLHQMADAVFMEEMSDFDITPRQFGALATVNTFPGTDQAGVASTIGTDRSTIGGIVDRLVLRQLIEPKGDPKDRRVKKLYLTDAGEELLKASREQIANVQRRMLEILSADEQELLAGMMRKLVWHYNKTARFPVTNEAYKSPLDSEADS